MATKNTKPSTPRSKSPSKAVERSRAGTFDKATKRIQKSAVGRRTTLRVPSALDTEASRLARELNISGNEALVRLAALGAESARRERELRRVIENRHAAVMGPADAEAGAPFPSVREMRDAILFDRD